MRPDGLYLTMVQDDVEIGFFNIVLDNGEIESIGSHQELLKKSDFYRGTWELQQ